MDVGEFKKYSKKGILRLRQRVTTASSPGAEETRRRREGGGGPSWKMKPGNCNSDLWERGMASPLLGSLRQSNKANDGRTGRSRKPAAAPAATGTSGRSAPELLLQL